MICSNAFTVDVTGLPSGLNPRGNVPQEANESVSTTVACASWEMENIFSGSWGCDFHPSEVSFRDSILFFELLTTLATITTDVQGYQVGHVPISVWFEMIWQGETDVSSQFWNEGPQILSLYFCWFSLGTKLIGAQIPHQEMLIEAVILTAPRIVGSESEATQETQQRY